MRDTLGTGTRLTIHAHGNGLTRDEMIRETWRAYRQTGGFPPFYPWRVFVLDPLQYETTDRYEIGAVRDVLVFDKHGKWITCEGVLLDFNDMGQGA